MEADIAAASSVMKGAENSPGLEAKTVLKQITHLLNYPLTKFP
jgi:hypothetical protein